MAPALLAALWLAVVQGPATAANRSVAPDPTGRALGLERALAAAAPGDTLWLSPGVYRGSFTLRLGVSLVGRAGADSTILDADGERYVLFGRGLDSTTVVAGLTLQNGRRDHPNSGGGGIYLYGSSPLVLGNVFRNHLGYLGPGVYANYGCRPVIAGNVFRDNEGYLGGAVAAYENCAPLLYDNVFLGNRAVSGGAVLFLNSTGVVLANTIAGNRADPGGGGALYLDSSPVLVQRNVMAHNRDARADGGAVYALDDDRPARLRENVFWENEGGDAGGLASIRADDKNCNEDPGFGENLEKALEASPSIRCQAGAGARPRPPGTLPAVPDSVLALWRNWILQTDR